MDHVSEDYYYSDDDNVYDSDDHDDTMKSLGNKEKKYTVLSECDIRQRQEDCITEVSNVLCVSKAVALILLLEYNWSVNNVHEVWFADEEKVRKTICLLDQNTNTPTIYENRRLCRICLYRRVLGRHEKVHDAGCGHFFCSLCWKDYITKSIENGAGCLNLRCLDPDCSVPVGQALVKEVVSDKDYGMYLRYLVRSYEGNDYIKFCPAARCDYAVEFKYKVSCRGNFDVTCVCTHSFCWKCMEEAHSPVDCDTAAKWMSKRSDENETESLNWIMAHCKPCPRCERQIESKNKYLQLMTCICGFEFCYLCLSPWGFGHTCNQVSQDEKGTNKPKNMLDRYTDFYEKWAANESLREKAKGCLQANIEKLKKEQGMTSSQLSFVTETWQLIIECRRVLKWTYAYRYYLPEDETKSQLFEYLQGGAESRLERLYHYAEKDMMLQHYGEGMNLIRVTQELFLKLVQEVENGNLDELGSSGNRDISLTERFDNIEVS
ncbi:E3 ubiquitin-protein ligase arih1 [Thalictrum thalictroides]|uniref:RBR-type E3 ubiquitin transferase n=1 Tax=Thalictrum thalictroides TaxID=46969 RepID=A0A7J6UT66_THATH|nr:E3 ubiquitin-protein ligase arih1 [Thalictrum thalictroides]